MPLVIRPATADDDYAIKAIVRAARLIRVGLDWPRFVVAVWGPDIIGVGQVKPHGDGTRELASITVVPEWRGQGIGGMVVRALLARETGTVHLMCLPEMEGYYARFGFRRLPPDELPPYFRRLARVVGVIARISGGRAARMSVMRRESQTSTDLSD
jgi:amino-acid N-acetyltransferase